ncbi:outer membrane beta-barrel family protein [Tenacibaculum sp. M341]|uniref:outer membrane beta-barrel family protein n=1 Tax=Tenacibaculum sp. M341 TaxID=2530339 RepID=UPI0010451871|nr:outer membrane beta-barrel family protein [Tenacibaculum sp. M341]TCI84835.1 TonB-dependent receptor [Tenacibaculum sp. M341]
MKHVLYIFLLSSITFYAQTGAIKGKVIDKNSQEVLPYVNVILKSGEKIVTGGITDEKGFFSIKNIPYNTYKVSIQFIGYKSEYRNITLNADQKTMNLGIIHIEEDAVALENVEITAERSTIEQKIDRKVVNVGKDLTTTGASASDIMNNIPSVSVNQDGDISLRGNDNVRILVDGKPTNIDPRDILQQIPSTSIKTIELITNPSAKYNPEGMSGIINITLKKNTALGFNGAINVGFTQGEGSRYNNSLNLNYSNGKINFYGSYNNRFGDQITTGVVTRTLEQTRQSTRNINNQESHLVKIGFDYFIDKKNTFSIYTNQNISNRVSDGNRSITFFTNPSANFQQMDDLKRKNRNQVYNIDFKHVFSENHTIELEVDFNQLKQDRNNDFNYTVNSPVADYDEIINDNRNNTTINLDYENSVAENSTLQLGAEARLNKVENVYETDRVDFRDSNFSFDRKIYSFYTTFSQKWEQWQYNLGVRLESYKADNEFLEVGEELQIFSDKQFNIYPSGFLKYIPSENAKSSYVLSFSRRVDRPSLNQINPIRQISTPLTIITGNPNLLPQFTNSIELNYTRKLNKGNFTIGGFYRRVHDDINRRGFFDEDNPTVLVIDYDNFDSTNAYGLEFSTNYKLNNWWRLNGSVDVYSRNQQGIIEDQDVEVSNTLFNVKLSNSFKATKALTFQLFTLYTGKQRVLQYELEENFFANIGARYSFAKGKGSINLNFNDIFRTQRFAFNAFRTVVQEGEFKRDTQAVFIGLSYRFGIKNKKAGRKKRDSNTKADKFL